MTPTSSSAANALHKNPNSFTIGPNCGKADDVDNDGNVAGVNGCDGADGENGINDVKGFNGVSDANGVDGDTDSLAGFGPDIEGT